MYSPDGSEDLRFWTDYGTDADVMTLDGISKWVGIGTTLPSTTLHVRGASSEVMPLRLHRPNEGGANYGVGLEFVLGEDGDADVERIYGDLLTCMDGASGNAAGGFAHNGYMMFRPSFNGTPTERMRISSAGNVGIGTSSPNSKLHLYRSITDPSLNASEAYGQFVDVNLSGSTAITGNKHQGGIFVDVDTSTTGGDKTNEHRVYGLYVDTRQNTAGDSDYIVGVRSYTESQRSGTPTTQTTNLRSGEFTAVSDETADCEVANLVGMYSSVSLQDAGVVDNANGAHTNAFIHANRSTGATSIKGLLAEIDVANSRTGGDITVGDARVIHALFDHNVATGDDCIITNGHLLRGTYAVATSAQITNKWGVYIENEDENYFEGRVSMDSTVRIGGGKGTNDTGISLMVGDDLGVSYTSATAPHYISLGESTSEKQGLMMGQSSTDYFTLQTEYRTTGGDSYEGPYLCLHGVEDSTNHIYYLAFKDGGIGMGLGPGTEPTDDWDHANTNLHIWQDKSTGVKIERTDLTPSLAFKRDDTTVTGDNGIGSIIFTSNDTNDANTNARMMVFKDDGGVSYAPMAFKFETGMSGTKTERLRITSDGGVIIGDTATVQGKNSMAQGQLTVASQATGVYPQVLVEYYDTSTNPDNYVSGGFKTGTALLKLGTFASDTPIALYGNNIQTMRIHSTTTAAGDSKINFGPTTAEPSHRMRIEGTDYEGGSDPTGPVQIQFTNYTTGLSSTDGALVGLDTSNNLEIENQYASADVLIRAASGRNLNVLIDGTSELKVESSKTTFGGNIVGSGGGKEMVGFRPRRIHLRNSSDGGENMNTNSYVAVEFGTELFKDSDYFTHSNTTDTSEITVIKAGYYEVNYSIQWENTGTNRAVVQTLIHRNGNTVVETENMAYSRGAGWGPKMTNSDSYWIQCLAGDVISIRGKKADSDQTDACETVAARCWIQIVGWPEDEA